MYTAGIDPGLTETGMVLLAPKGRYLSGITFRAAKQGPDLERICNLADAIVATLKSWVYDYRINAMLIGIETPVLKATAVTNYRKQVSLIQEIEASMWRWRNDVNDSGFKLAISEMTPSQSKLVATGNGAADKSAMIAVAPAPIRALLNTRPTQEALADAHGHALAARQLLCNLVDLQAIARYKLEPTLKVFKLEVED